MFLPLIRSFFALFPVTKIITTSIHIAGIGIKYHFVPTFFSLSSPPFLHFPRLWGVARRGVVFMFCFPLPVNPSLTFSCHLSLTSFIFHTYLPISLLQFPFTLTSLSLLFNVFFLSSRSLSTLFPFTVSLSLSHSSLSLSFLSVPLRTLMNLRFNVFLICWNVEFNACGVVTVRECVKLLRLLTLLTVFHLKPKYWPV